MPTSRTKAEAKPMNRSLTIAAYLFAIGAFAFMIYAWIKLMEVTL